MIRAKTYSKKPRPAVPLFSGLPSTADGNKENLLGGTLANFPEIAQSRKAVTKTYKKPGGRSTKRKDDGEDEKGDEAFDPKSKRAKLSEHRPVVTKTAGKDHSQKDKALFDHLQKLKAQFDEIDKFQVAEAVDTDDDNEATEDPFQGEKLLEMSVLNSLVGKTNAARQLDFLSIDTDSGIIDDGSSMQSIQASDELPEAVAFLEQQPLASSEDDFSSIAQKKSPSTRKSSILKPVPEDLESFLFSNFVQPSDGIPVDTPARPSRRSDESVAGSTRSSKSSIAIEPTLSLSNPSSSKVNAFAKPVAPSPKRAKAASTARTKQSSKTSSGSRSKASSSRASSSSSSASSKGPKKPAGMEVLPPEVAALFQNISSPTKSSSAGQPQLPDTPESKRIRETCTDEHRPVLSEYLAYRREMKETGTDPFTIEEFAMIRG